MCNGCCRSSQYSPVQMYTTLILINDPELKPHGHIFRHAHTQIGLAQWRQHEMKCAHFPTVVRAAPYHVRRGTQQLQVPWMSIPEGEKDRLRTCDGPLNALISSRRICAGRQKTEAHAAL